MDGVTFGAMLDARRRAVGLSMGKLARIVGIDPAYVSRMIRGYPPRPSRSVVLGLAATLRLDALDTDRLLFAAGHAPERDWQAVALDYALRIAAIDRALVGVVEFPAASREAAS